MNVAQKSIFPVLLLTCSVLAFTIPARSQDVTNQVKSSTDTNREEARQRRSKTATKGVIKEVDLLRHQVRLMTEDGMRTFPYTSRTYIFRDKEKITADNLKVGETVGVRFNTDKDGNVIVVLIKSRTPSELMEPPSVGSAAATNSPSGNSP